MKFDGTLSKYFLKYNKNFDFELNFPLFGLLSYIPFFKWKINSKPGIIEPQIHVTHSKVKPRHGVKIEQRQGYMNSEYQSISSPLSYS